MWWGTTETPKQTKPETRRQTNSRNNNQPRLHTWLHIRHTHTHNLNSPPFIPFRTVQQPHSYLFFHNAILLLGGIPGMLKSKLTASSTGGSVFSSKCIGFVMFVASMFSKMFRVFVIFSTLSVERRVCCCWTCWLWCTHVRVFLYQINFNYMNTL